MSNSPGQRQALIESIAKSDVLERVADSVAIHLYEMELRPDGAYECTAFVGAGLERLLGTLPADRSPEQAWEDAVHPEDRHAYDAAYESLLRGRAVELEYRLIGYDGQTRWVWDRMQPRETAGSLFVDGIVVDVTERHRTAEELAELQRRLAHLAYHDPLTDLPNRAHFDEQVDQALSRARAAGTLAAVVFLDLDEFKNANDSFGHAAGDQLLCEVAERMRSATRGSDFVARYGGDEFVVLVADITPGDRPQAGVEALASRLRDLFTTPFRISSKLEVRMSASVGTAFFPSDGKDAKSLLIAADRAMYIEKTPKRPDPQRRLRSI